MSKRAIVITTAVTSLLAAGLALPGVGRADSPGRRGQTEALLGSYSCSAGTTNGFLYLTLNATGDVLDDETVLYRGIPVPSTPGETCEFHSAAALDSVSSGGCAVSPLESSGDETGESRAFQFVCHAERSGIIAAIADLSVAFLTRSP